MELPADSHLSTRVTKDVSSSMRAVAIAGALLACALGLFCPGQPKSATAEEYSSLGKVLLSLQDVMMQ